MTTDILYEETAECRLRADFACVPLALQKVKDYCLARGLRPNLWCEMELAAAEALNNAVEHGCAGMEGATVLLRWGWKGEILEVEITDPGQYAADCCAASLPDDPLDEGGRGAFLMAQLTDRIEHRSSSQGHTLHMEKKVGLASWNPGEAAEMEATIESMAEDLSHSYEDLSALFRFAEELATSADLADFLERSLSRLLTLVPAQAAYARFLSADKESLELISLPSLNLPWVAGTLKLDAGGKEVDAVRQANVVTIEDCTSLSEGDPLRRHRGAAFVCPIFFRSKVLGCLVVTQHPKTPYFSAGELGLIRVVADFLGIVRTTNKLREQRQAQQRALRELEIASAIQQSLLPRRFPDSPTYRVFGVCQSAQQVGGDYFDALNIGTDGILLVIADVMGKGVPAALLATIFRTAIHARLHLASQPGLLLTEVNLQIAPDLGQNDMFITAQVAYLSRADHTLLLANAGHCPLLHCESGCEHVSRLQTDGIPLGVLDNFEYPQQSYPIARGDRLILLTDGLYEVEQDEMGMLGIERLVREIQSLRAEPPADLCGQLLDFVRTYSGGKPASDDRTLITVERLR